MNINIRNIALWIVVLVAANSGVASLLDYNVLEHVITSSRLMDVVDIAFGLSGLFLLAGMLGIGFGDEE